MSILPTISLVMISIMFGGFSIGNYFFDIFAQEHIGTVIPNDMKELDEEFNTNTNTTDNTSNQTLAINNTSLVTPSDMQFTAESVFNTNSLIADKDATEVVVMIPNSKIIGQKFIPSNITIAPATTVIWINGQNTTNGIALYNEKGKELLSNSSIPFANATSYEFTHKGTYKFTSTSDPTVSGIINVVSAKTLPDIAQTNATTHTIGLFAAPASEKDYWNYHLNTIGFNVKSLYDYLLPNVTTTIEEADEDEKGTLYLFTQKLSKFSSVVDRVSVKLHNVEKQIADLD